MPTLNDAVEMERTGTPPADDGTCLTCGAALVGNYCHNCGEKRADARRLSVKHFMGEAVQELTSLDSKLFRTVKLLLFKPGFLTLEWLAGRRKPYVKPLNLCLAVFALTIFAYSAYKPVSTYDFGRVVSVSGNGNLVQLLDKWAARKNISRDMLIDNISDKWQSHISLVQILVVVALALMLQLIFLFSHRYFVEHLIFSLHFVSFTFFFVVLLWPVYFLVGIEPTPRSQLLASGVWLIFITYLFLAVKRVYKLRLFKTILLSATILVGYLAGYIMVYSAALLTALIHVVKF